MDLDHLEVIALLDDELVGIQAKPAALVRSSSGLHVS
jgi:hypothetical protein